MGNSSLIKSSQEFGKSFGSLTDEKLHEKLNHEEFERVALVLRTSLMDGITTLPGGLTSSDLREDFSSTSPKHQPSLTRSNNTKSFRFSSRNPRLKDIKGTYSSETALSSIARVTHHDEEKFDKYIDHHDHDIMKRYKPLPPLHQQQQHHPHSVTVAANQNSSSLTDCTPPLITPVEINTASLKQSDISCIKQEIQTSQQNINLPHSDALTTSCINSETPQLQKDNINTEENLTQSQNSFTSQTEMEKTRELIQKHSHHSAGASPKSLSNQPHHTTSHIEWSLTKKVL